MSNERVKELAIQLKQSQDPTSKYSPPLTVLKAVAGLPDSAITVQILVATQIGKVVNGLKSDESKTKWGEETAVLAKQIVKKWKKLAKTEAPSKLKAPVVKSEKSPAQASTAPPNAATPAQDEALTAYASGLQPSVRGKVVLNLRNCLLTGSKGGTVEMLKDESESAISTMASEAAKAVEAAMKEKFPNYDKDYMAKARQLTFNVKKNSDLTANILVGFVNATDLVNMTHDQLATKEKLKKLEEQMKAIEDSRRLDWETENEDKINEQAGIKGDLLTASLFTCGRCKSIKTTSTQKQTRSADEPMTVFVLCKNCGNRWKC